MSKVKVKVTGNENVKFVFFAHYLCQKWIDLRQTKTHLPTSFYFVVDCLFCY